jgi:hypothetical protein
MQLQAARETEDTTYKLFMLLQASTHPALLAPLQPSSAAAISQAGTDCLQPFDIVCLKDHYPAATAGAMAAPPLTRGCYDRSITPHTGELRAWDNGSYQPGELQQQQHKERSLQAWQHPEQQQWPWHGQQPLDGAPSRLGSYTRSQHNVYQASQQPPIFGGHEVRVIL